MCISYGLWILMKNGISIFFHLSLHLTILPFLWFYQTRKFYSRSACLENTQYIHFKWTGKKISSRYLALTDGGQRFSPPE